MNESEPLLNERNPTAAAVEVLLEKIGIKAQVTSPTDLNLNHVNVTTFTNLSRETAARIRTIAAQTDTSLEFEVRDPNAEALRDEAGGRTYAEMDTVRRTASAIAHSQGGNGDPGSYMPRGARYFGNH